MRGQDTDAHTIRFPRDLKKRVAEEAEKEHRSFNSQVIRLIELGLECIQESKKEEDGLL